MGLEIVRSEFGDIKKRFLEIFHGGLRDIYGYTVKGAGRKMQGPPQKIILTN